MLANAVKYTFEGAITIILKVIEEKLLAITIYILIFFFFIIGKKVNMIINNPNTYHGVLLPTYQHSYQILSYYYQKDIPRSALQCRRKVAPPKVRLTPLMFLQLF